MQVAQMQFQQRCYVDFILDDKHARQGHRGVRSIDERRVIVINFA